jgi:hypothetical protein
VETITRYSHYACRHFTNTSAIKADAKDITQLPANIAIKPALKNTPLNPAPAVVATWTTAT